MPKNVQPFEEYVEEQGMAMRGTPCTICTLPPDARGYVIGAWEAGWRGTAIARYLTAQGFPASEAKVSRHFRGGH